MSVDSSNSRISSLPNYIHLLRITEDQSTSINTHPSTHNSTLALYRNNHGPTRVTPHAYRAHPPLHPRANGPPLLRRRHSRPISTRRRPNRRPAHHPQRNGNRPDRKRFRQVSIGHGPRSVQSGRSLFGGG